MTDPILTRAEEEPPEKTGEIHWPQWGATIRYEAYSHYLNFKVREGTQQPDGFVYYYSDGIGEGTFENAERFIDGFIKWDGCSHLYFGDENGYLHLCGGDHFRNLRGILKEVFLIASREMSAFAPDVANLSLLDQ